jgi:hypothetical protein
VESLSSPRRPPHRTTRPAAPAATGVEWSERQWRAAPGSSSSTPLRSTRGRWQPYGPVHRSAAAAAATRYALRTKPGWNPRAARSMGGSPPSARISRRFGGFLVGGSRDRCVGTASGSWAAAWGVRSVS